MFLVEGFGVEGLAFKVHHGTWRWLLGEVNVYQWFCSANANTLNPGP